MGESFYSDIDTPFLMATVKGVNPGRGSVDVYTEGGEKELLDIPVMAPYFSPEFGQGLFQIPEINTVCVVARHQSEWFVLGFLPPASELATQGKTAEDELSGSQNLFSKFQGQTKNILDNLRSKNQTSQPPGRQSYKSTQENDMIAGDGIAKTKAGNKFQWLTNGTLIAQASNLCLRIWSRLTNKIIDVYVNKDELSPGTSKRVTNDAATKNVDETIEIRKNTKDKFPSLVIRRGNDADVYEVKVQTASGGAQVFRFHVADDGKMTIEVGNPVSSGVSVTYSPNGDVATTNAGQYNVIAAGNVKVTSTSKVTVDAPSIVIGEGGEDFLVKFTSLATKINTHTHTSSAEGSPTSPPTVPILIASDATTKTRAG